MPEIHLTLPLPPSPNTASAHPMQEAKQKNSYRKRAWAEACQQHPPMMQPPEKVVLSATMYVHNRRDQDNLYASLKYLLDTLKQEQSGNVRWRQMLYVDKGFFVDDSPDHLHVMSVSQEVDRSDPRCEITLMWEGEA